MSIMQVFLFVAGMGVGALIMHLRQPLKALALSAVLFMAVVSLMIMAGWL